MKKWLMIVVVLIVVGGVNWWWFRTKGKETRLHTEPVEELDHQVEQRDMGEVEVTLKPKSLVAGEAAVIELTINTHTVELDYDLNEVAKMSDDRGNSYQLVSWNGGRGGHHLQGELIFTTIDSGTKEMSLRLGEIEGRTEVFTWKLERG